MRRSGFTLLELLVALSLGVMLLFLSSQVFSAALRSRETLVRVNGDASALRRAFEAISRDMHSATVPPDDSGLTFGLTATPAGQGRNVLQFAAVVGEPLLAGRAATETSLIQYAIDEDPDTGRSTFWRYETPYPVPDGTTPGQAGASRATPLLPGVTSASYLFYSTEQQTWVETWDNVVGLPTAIRIDLVLDGGSPPASEQEAIATDDPSRRESWVFSLPAAKFANDRAAEASDTGSTEETGTGSSTGSTGTGGGL